MGAELGDPNREAVGLPPIWTGSDAPEAEGAKAPKAKAPKAPEPAPAPAPSEEHTPGAT